MSSNSCGANTFYSPPFLNGSRRTPVVLPIGSGGGGRGVMPVQINGVRRLRRGSGARIAYVSVFVANVIFLSTAQISLSDQTRVTLQLEVSLSNLV
jgi:hypothetical protein